MPSLERSMDMKFVLIGSSSFVLEIACPELAEGLWKVAVNMPDSDNVPVVVSLPLPPMKLPSE